MSKKKRPRIQRPAPITKLTIIQDGQEWPLIQMEPAELSKGHKTCTYDKDEMFQTPNCNG